MNNGKIEPCIRCGSVLPFKGHKCIDSRPVPLDIELSVIELIDKVAPDHCRTTCIEGTGNNAYGCTRCDLHAVAMGEKVNMTAGSWYHEGDEDE